LAFAADGRTLVSGSQDTTILVWSLGGSSLEAQPGDVNASARQSHLQQLWTKMGEEDGAGAYRAIWDMSNASGSAVPFLKKHLRPAPAADENRILHLIGQLDDPRFLVRQQAAQELEKLGELAGPALRRTLEGKPTAEVRRRAELLLDLADAHHLSTEGLRTLRAVEVLERIATSDARKLLQSLGSGAPGATVTQEAQAALKRIDMRLPTATSQSMTKR
jgi:hypothetical protein